MVIGGLLNITRNGKLYSAEGHWKYNLGLPKKEAQLNSAGQVMGYVETAQSNFVKGNIFVKAEDSILEIINEKDLTVVLELNTGKTIVVSGAWIETEGTINSEKNLMEIKIVGTKAEEA